MIFMSESIRPIGPGIYANYQCLLIWKFEISGFFVEKNVTIFLLKVYNII